MEQTPGTQTWRVNGDEAQHAAVFNSLSSTQLFGPKSILVGNAGQTGNSPPLSSWQGQLRGSEGWKGFWKSLSHALT